MKTDNLLPITSLVDLNLFLVEICVKVKPWKLKQWIMKDDGLHQHTHLIIIHT